MLRRTAGLVLFCAGLTCASSVGDGARSAEYDPELHPPAVLVAVHGDWGTYAYDDHGSEICYILAVDKLMAAPAAYDRATAYFMVSRIPGDAQYTPEFRASYVIQQGAALAVSGMSFDLLVWGSAAWIADLDDEPVAIAAMKAGTSMIVSTRTDKGMLISHLFSLRGFNAALDSIDTCAYKLLSDASRTDWRAAA